MSALPSWARKGVKVVCVDVPWTQPPYPDEVYPTVGSVYTIRRVVHETSGTHLILREIRNPIMLMRSPSFGLVADEICFHISHFRPLVSDDDEAFERDVAPFRKYLTHRQPDEVDA